MENVAAVGYDIAGVVFAYLARIEPVIVSLPATARFYFGRDWTLITPNVMR